MKYVCNHSSKCLFLHIHFLFTINVMWCLSFCASHCWVVGLIVKLYIKIKINIKNRSILLKKYVSTTCYIVHLFHRPSFVTEQNIPKLHLFFVKYKFLPPPLLWVGYMMLQECSHICPSFSCLYGEQIGSVWKFFKPKKAWQWKSLVMKVNQQYHDVCRHLGLSGWVLHILWRCKPTKLNHFDCLISQ